MWSFARKSVLFAFKRNFHTSKDNFKQSRACKEDKPAIDTQFCLKPVEHKGHTIKKHDDTKRQTLYEFGFYAAACMPKWVQKVQMQHTDELELLVVPDGLFPVLSFLCHHQNACFNACSLVTAIDVPSREFRFEVVYVLQSLRYCQRIRVKTYTDELTPLHSACSLWYVCEWFEREVYDMFGIIFSHHPDLRRILTDYGFVGHPLRKDFPLVGYLEVRYDDELKKLVYEPVEFAQEMRNYQLESPWNYFNNFHEGFNTTPTESTK